MSQYLSEQDVSDYGRDLVDFSQRAALHAIAPHLQQIQEDNATLRQRLAIEARHRLDKQVEAAIPNWRDLDQHPDWHQWLLGIDNLSGRVRQNLLNEAKASGDAARCIAFFRSFFNRARSPAARKAASSQTRSSASSSGAIYTRSQIAQIYAAHRKGQYAGREDAWNRQEADIIAATREGRIRDFEYITK